MDVQTPLGQRAPSGTWGGNLQLDGLNVQQDVGLLPAGILKVVSRLSTSGTWTMVLLA